MLRVCHGCDRELPPAVTAELRLAEGPPVPLAWLCAACAADPPTLRRCVGDFRAARRAAPAALAPEEATTLATLVRAARRRRGGTQLDLALRAGVGTSTLGGLEAGRVRRPTRRTLARLAAALELPVADLAAADQDATGVGR